MALVHLVKRRGNGFGEKILKIIDYNGRIIGTEPMYENFIDPKKSEMSKEKIIDIKL